VRRHGRILVFAGVLVREDGWLRGIREVVRHRHGCLVRHHVDRIIDRGRHVVGRICAQQRVSDRRDERRSIW
jgi:hypothetical protein